MARKRKKPCRAYRQSESGNEYCEKGSGHRGWHSYTYHWSRSEKPIAKVIWVSRAGQT
jgi:hypothetical protein